MSPEAGLDFALRVAALGWLGLAAHLHLRVGGRIALDLAVPMGVAAFACAQLGALVPNILAAALAAGTAAAAGAGLGALGAGLGAARAAALGLSVQLAASALAPRLDVTGGSMGLPLPAPTLVAMALCLGLGLGLFALVVRRAPWAQLLAVRLFAEAPGLGAALGRSPLGPRAGFGALTGAFAGVAGVLLTASLPHLHAGAFGLGRSLDGLAVGLLAPRPAATLPIAVAWTALFELGADAPLLRSVALAAVLIAAAGRR